MSRVLRSTHMYFNKFFVALPRPAGAEQAAQSAAPVGVVELMACEDPRIMAAIRKLMDKRTTDACNLIGYGLLRNLAVAPPYRRKGCARALIAHAEATVAGWGFRWVALQTESTNAHALRLYRRCGYSRVRRERWWWRPWLSEIVTLVKELRCSPAAMLALLLLQWELHKGGHLFPIMLRLAVSPL